MKVWLVRVPFGDGLLSDELLERGLSGVDAASRDRVLRFYHVEDRWRCLVGLLMPRVLLTDSGVAADTIAVSATPAGKPYISSPSSNVSFNVSHDSSYVAMAFQIGLDPGLRSPDVGIDIMKAELPRGETIRSFVSVISDQLTTQERLNLALHFDDRSAAIEILFKYWTIKEAYTKAIGIGLNFDLSRIEYIPSRRPPEVDRIIVDGVALVGWDFQGFTWKDGPSSYLGMAACHHGGSSTSISWVPLGSTMQDWVIPLDIGELIKRTHPSS